MNFLTAFKTELESKSQSWGYEFLDAFDANYECYAQMLTDEKLNDDMAFTVVANLIKALENSVRESVKQKRSDFSFNVHYDNKENFDDLQNVYRKDNKIERHRVIDLLTKKENWKYEDYFEKFVKLTVFLCGVYDQKLLYLADQPSISVRPLKLDEISRSKREEYYWFYNSPTPNKVEFGYLTVYKDKVTVKYYEGGNDANNATVAELTTMVVNGSAKRKFLSDNQVLILNVNEVDKKESHAVYAATVMESFFVLKKYGHSNEQAIFGTVAFFTRDNFPFSTAVVLIEKGVYDDKQNAQSKYRFEEMIKAPESCEVPPEVYYYLFHQSVSIKGILDLNNNQPFIAYDEFPFFEESQHLPLMAGVYKGLTLLDWDAENCFLAIVKLEIFATGLVKLFIKNTDTGHDEDTVGFVKFLDFNRVSNVGKIFLALRYDYPKQYNKMNVFLHIRVDDLSVIMTGGFSADSQITLKPAASSIVFEKISDGVPVSVCNVPVTRRSKFASRIPNEKLMELQEENRTLFDIYFDDTNTLFSDHYSFNIVKRYLVDNKPPRGYRINFSEYEAFISIPLSDERTYEQHCKMVLNLRHELSRRLGFDKNKIYCACLADQALNDGEAVVEYLSFNDYNRRTSGDEGEKFATFSLIREKIENSRYVFFIYPKIPKDNLQQRISSSIVEVAYALGLKKKIIIFYDGSENNFLPENLMVLNRNWSRAFDSGQDNPFSKIFTPNLVAFIRNTLRLNGVE